MLLRRPLYFRITELTKNIYIVEEDTLKESCCVNIIE